MDPLEDITLADTRHGPTRKATAKIQSIKIRSGENIFRADRTVSLKRYRISNTIIGGSNCRRNLARRPRKIIIRCSINRNLPSLRLHEVIPAGDTPLHGDTSIIVCPGMMIK